jgi:hypothetical protein
VVRGRPFSDGMCRQCFSGEAGEWNKSSRL